MACCVENGDTLMNLRLSFVAAGFGLTVVAAFVQTQTVHA